MNETLIRERWTSLSSELRQIEQRAKSAGRDLSPAEEARLVDIVREARELKAVAAAYVDDQAMRKQILAIGEGIGVGDRSDADGFVVGGFRASGKAIHSALARGGSKALVASGSVAVPATRDDELFHDPGKLRWVQDLMPSKAVESDVVSYLRQTTKTHAAAAVTGSDVKPTSTYTVTEVSAQLDLIAHVSE